MANVNIKILIVLLKGAFPDSYKDKIEHAIYIQEQMENIYGEEINDLIDYYIIYSYKNHPELSVEDRKWYVYGSIFCVVNDSDLNYDYQYIREIQFYKEVDKICDMVKINGCREMIELGIDETFFNNHIKQIRTKSSVYYDYVNNRALIGSALFKHINKLELLTNLVTFKYPDIAISKLFKSSEKELDLSAWIGSLSHLFINKSDIECLQIMAADCIYSNKANVVSELSKERLVSEYYNSKVLPDELKGKAGEEYIKEVLTKGEKEISKEINNSCCYKIQMYDAELKKNNCPYMDLTDEDINIILEFDSTILKEYADDFYNFKAYYEKAIGPHKYLNNAIILSDMYFPSDIYNFDDKLSLVFGIIHNFKLEKKSKGNAPMKEVEYCELLDKRIDKLKNIPVFLNRELVELGIDAALFDCHQNEVLENGSWLLYKLSEDFFGECLFHITHLVERINDLFNQTYPGAFIMVNADGEVKYPSTQEWISDVLTGFLISFDLSDKQCMECLSAAYFMNVVNRVMKDIDIDKDMMCSLYARTNLISEEYKTDFSYEVIDLEYDLENDLKSDLEKVMVKTKLLN